MSVQHILSVSGGKDSTALYLRALELGRPFRAIFADTGNEHEATLDYVATLAARTGGPVVETVRADFAAQMAGKRDYIERKWAGKGVSEARIRQALDILQPTGNPYLDLCLWKGRFPGVRSRFCTQELKIRPLSARMAQLQGCGRPIVSWQGVRAEESKMRATLKRQQVVSVNYGAEAEIVYHVWRPLLSWTLDDVLAIHRRHGLALNPLYGLGFDRVGCMPCIMCQKRELRLMAQWAPQHVDRLERWEELVKFASKHGLASFFAHDKTPGDHQSRADIPMPGIRDVVEWSKTSRGGYQYDGLDLMQKDLGTVCGAWGHCE